MNTFLFSHLNLSPLPVVKDYVTTIYIQLFIPHSSTLDWKIPWTEEPGRLQTMGWLSWTRLSDFTLTFHFHALEKEMATHSSVRA